jgi:uncharacterized protein YkwD
MVSCLQVRPTGQCVEGAQPLSTRSLAMLFRRVASAALLGSLGAISACGGGGAGGTPAPTPPPPAPAPSGPLAAVVSVPAPVGYDADRLAAFNRLNEIRLSAGLGMLAQQPLMDEAAQAHADWEIANNVYGHVEQAGTPGFTGAHWYDRDQTLGYSPTAGGEVATSGYDAVDAVDILANVAYHRAILLAIEPVDVGIGRSSQVRSNVSEPLVLDIAVPGNDAVRGQGQLAQSSVGGIVVWPIDGAQAVGTHMGGESPNPVAGSDVFALGMPVSLTVGSSKAISVTSFSLTNTTSGDIVPTYLLTNANDPNELVPTSYVAAIPLAALDSNTSFAVDFEGSLLDPETNTSTSLSRTWTFTTGLN